MSARHWLLGVFGCVLLGGAIAAAPPASGREGARIELGRRLFLDPAVSQTGRTSCASCHNPEHGFSDPRTVSVDENGPSRRHSQPVLDLADGKGMHWDGEFDTVRQLLVARVATPAEAVTQQRELLEKHMAASLGRGGEVDRPTFEKRMADLTPPYYGPQKPLTPGTPPTVTVAERLSELGHYDVGFRMAFGDAGVTNDRVIDAMEAYLLSLESGPSPYDRYLAGEPDAMGEAARRGLALFQGKANCAACHSTAGDGRPPALSDGDFHNTGVALQHVTIGLRRSVTGDEGRGNQSFAMADLGKFKTPSLRNVARRPPFMHDGSFETLEEVVRYYDRGGTPNAHLDRAIRPLDLTQGEVDDLVEFLKALTSDERPGLGPVAPHRAALTRVRIVDLHGHPLRGVDLEVVPFGDRLAASRGDELPLVVTTDRHGEIEFPFPLWTHVLLRAEGYEVGLDRPIPDYVSRTTLEAAPRTGVLVRLLRSGDGRSLPREVTAVLPGGLGVRFERARKVSTREAYYRAPLPASTWGWTNVMLHLDGNVAVTCALDLSGGESDPVRVRAAR